MIKWLIIVIIVLVGGSWLFYNWSTLNVKGIVSGPACGETSPALFKRTGAPMASTAGNAVLQHDSSRNWDVLVQKAQLEDKKILVCYTTTTCGFCKMMKKDVLTNGNVAAYINENFLFVMLQVDETDTDPPFIKNWRKDVKTLTARQEIASYPTFAVCDTDGKMTGKLVGAMNAGDFVDNLREVSR